MAEPQETHKNPKMEGTPLFSQLVKQVLAVDDEELQPHLDRLIKSSISVVLESTLKRSKTQDVKELQKTIYLASSYFEKFQLAQNSEHRLVWLIGRLSALLGFVSILDNKLELNVDERLIQVVDNSKHIIDVLRTLYDKPQLSQDELAHVLELTSAGNLDDLTDEIDTMIDYGLVFEHDGGGETYYTLSARGKKVYNHLKLRNEITPEMLTDHFKSIFENLGKMLQERMTFKEAEDFFRQCARQYTTNPLELQCVIQKVIGFIENKNVELRDLRKDKGKLETSIFHLKWGRKDDELMFCHNERRADYYISNAPINQWAWEYKSSEYQENDFMQVPKNLGDKQKMARTRLPQPTQYNREKTGEVYV